jgi:hypothetical protein
MMMENTMDWRNNDEEPNVDTQIYKKPMQACSIVTNGTTSIL